MNRHCSAIPTIEARELVAPHAFFTRRGGVSTGNYASLNCGWTVGDNIANVMINRARAVTVMGGISEQLLGLKQVHGTNVIVVDKPWLHEAAPAADAMVTACSDVVLSIITGDCAPVLLADGYGRIVGVAHAGWRGAIGGILEATVMALRGLGAQEISAVIGPCIHQPSYEVGNDVREAALHKDNSSHKFFVPGRDSSHWWFDLPKYCAARLALCGVSATTLPFDTYASVNEFFSHRRRMLHNEGKGGLQISMIRARS